MNVSIVRFIINRSTWRGRAWPRNESSTDSENYHLVDLGLLSCASCDGRSERGTSAKVVILERPVFGTVHSGQINCLRPGRPAKGDQQKPSRTTKRPDMSSTTASQEELKSHRVPLAWRDQCSAYVVTAYSYAVSPNPLLAGHDHIIHVCLSNRPDGSYAHSLLLPLNVCRKDKYYLPWECENERHAYEKCVFVLLVFLLVLPDG